MDYIQQAGWLKAAAHPVRLQILNMLRQGEICVCHIENALGKRQAYVSQQLMVLREAGLVHTRKDGLPVFYRLADARVADLLALTCGPLDSVGHHALDHCPCPACTTTVTTNAIFG
jgi:ArsR family transcriptional regulator